MQDQRAHGEQRTVLANQHQPAAVRRTIDDRIAAALRHAWIVRFDAVVQYVNLAVDGQVFRDAGDGPGNRAEVLVEQTVGIHRAGIEGHAGGQSVHQSLPLEARKQLLAMGQRLAREGVQIGRHLPIQHA